MMPRNHAPKNKIIDSPDCILNSKHLPLSIVHLLRGWPQTQTTNAWWLNIQTIPSKKIFYRNISKAIFCRNNVFLMESHGLGTHKVQGFLKRPKNLRKPPHLFWHYWVNVKTSVRFFQILWPSHNVSTLRTKYVLKVQLRIPHICTPQFIWIICLNWPIIWDIFEKSPKHMPIVNGHR